MIECTTAAGFGANLPWNLEVNGNAASTNGITDETSLQTSYDRPTVSRILPEPEYVNHFRFFLFLVFFGRRRQRYPKLSHNSILFFLCLKSMGHSAYVLVPLQVLGLHHILAKSV